MFKNSVDIDTFFKGTLRGFPWFVLNECYETAFIFCYVDFVPITGFDISSANTFLSRKKPTKAKGIANRTSIIPDETGISTGTEGIVPE